MAFYFSSDTKALYDTDVFPVASLPENKVEISAAVYSELLTKQNQGYVILADGSGNPYTVNQSETTATDMKHSGSVATTLALGHVKIGNTMQAANDGTLDLNDGAVTTAKIVDGNVTAEKLASNAVETAKIKDANVTTAKIADANVTTAKLADEAVTTSKIADEAVTTAKIADGSVTEAKLDSVKDLLADETTLTLTENTNDFTFSVKDGGITTPKIADGAVTTAKIAAQAVTAAEIKDSTITDRELADGAVTRPNMADDFLFYDPNFASHSSGPSVVFETLGRIIEERYAGKPSNVVVVCNNLIPFTLDNTLYTAQTKAGYKNSNHLLVVNAYTVNLTVEDENQNTLKTIPPNTGALFVCMNEGNATGSGSVWIAIS